MAESEFRGPKQKRLPKFSRQPDAFTNRRLTPRSVKVIGAIARYRFLPTSLLVRLVEGNEDVTHRHLQQLFHKGLINRFAFAKLGSVGEFNYYLDNVKSLDLLAQHGQKPEQAAFDVVRRNKEKAYFKIHEEEHDSGGRMLFLKHELMIVKFHFLLEIGCWQSGGKVVLEKWRQGAELHDTVIDMESGEVLPHRPDAFFTLHFTHDPEGKNRANFFYEADRRTTSVPRMVQKFRAHAEFIRQGKHRARYGISRIRAVLIETLDQSWAEELRKSATSISASPMFWFTSEERLSGDLLRDRKDTNRPLCSRRPETVMARVWAATGCDSLFSLED